MIAYNNEYKRPKRECAIDVSLLGTKTVSATPLCQQTSVSYPGLPRSQSGSIDPGPQNEVTGAAASLCDNEIS